MAGEAIRQISEINERFRLRRIVVSTALILSDDKPTELITTLRKQQLTDSLDSQWWEFTITSHNGRSWTRHCTGEVAIQLDILTSAQAPQPYLKKVAPRKWFDTLRRAGLDLGVAFQRLENITVATATQQATGTVRKKSSETGRSIAIRRLSMLLFNSWASPLQLESLGSIRHAYLRAATR